MLLARLRGHAVLAFGALTMVLYFLVSLPVMLLTGSGDLPIWFARFAWSRSSLWLAGVRIAMEPLPVLPAGPVIFASNHESALDIWVLLARLPRSVRFVAKAELFEIPVFGAYMRLGGHVAVDRRNHAQAVAGLRHAAGVVRGGTSLIVFPEGTRSRDGRVHAFKKGPFVLANEAGVPVVPVAVSGAGRVTPKNVVAIWPGVIRLAVGEPVDPAAFPDKTALLLEVRRRILALHLAIGGAGGDDAEAVAGRGVEGAAG
jgi:1-acyl-sn-glycerol-3-phosphate acyltransferase